MAKHARLIFFFFAAIFVSTALFASVQYNLEDFEESSLTGSLGATRIADRSFAKASLSPDFQFGPINLGLDFRLYLPTDGGSSPAGLENVSLRSVSFDLDHVAGLKWGRLSHVNFGYGLLMDDYDSGAFGSSEFNTSKAGLLLYASYEDMRVDAMWTASSVKAGRLSYTLEDTVFLGSPLIFGANYVTDSDGINQAIESTSTTVHRPSLSAYSADVGLPLGGDFLTLYGEYAKFADNGQGAGATAGFKGSFYDFLSYRMEYRRLGTGFVPAYFNNVYEATSFDFTKDAPLAAVNGFLGSLGGSLFDGHFRSDLMYEAYEGHDPILTGAVGWKRVANTVGVINYSRPFGNQGNAVAIAEIIYYGGGMVDYVATMKRVYLPDTVSDSYSIGLRLNLASVFPTFPYLKP